MQFYAFHGYYKEEQKMGNQFVLDVEVTLDNFDQATDQIQDTVNYEKIYQICKEEMKITQQLIETVAFNILTRIKDLNHVDTAKICISKMHPKMGGPLKSATVEMAL